MGLCCSVSTSNDATNSRQNGDESSLINSNQNAITEAMSQQDIVAPPAPLLKEINFAAINEEDGNATDSSLNDDDIKEILNEEEEENA